MTDEPENNTPEEITELETEESEFESSESVEEVETTTDDSGEEGADNKSADSPSTDPKSGVFKSDADHLIGTIKETKYGKMKYISIVTEMEKSYLDYAMSVIVSRALPDVRDGLKPVHRRILYSMYRSGIHHTSSYKKSARIVGDVLGKYHPHGDAPVYGALVRLAQDFNMRYLLVDGQGNFGSVDGDSPAAMRYTEARLGKITQELLADLTKNTVPFIDNFDGSLKEPTVLPGKLPNLLLMGSEGIAVGMATKIPTHNLVEVCNAIIAMIKSGKSEKVVAETEPALAAALDNPPETEVTVETAEKKVLKGDASKKSEPDELSTSAIIDQVIQTDPHTLAGTFLTEITIDELMEHIQGPDFPTGGIIYDHKAIREAYQTGKGKVLIRAKASIEEKKGGGYQIIVTELPYQVNKARLLMKIAELVRDKKIMGIRDLNDDSDRTGMQITIELKRDARPKVVLNKLFAYSQLQTSFPVNMVALNSDGTPQLMNIKQILREYIVHRQLVIVRRSQFDLMEARDRAHILEGLLIALKNLDDVIETIRRSADSEAAKVALMEKFGLTEVQSLAILEMQLKRLAALERQKIEDEYLQIKKTIDGILKLLGDPIAILGVITQEVEEMIAQYGDERKTKLVKGKVDEFSEEDLIANEATVITLTETGYIKRLSPSSFRSQSRGGKGTIGLKMKDEDMVRCLLSAQTHDTILFFTNQGRVFKLRAFEVPESSRQAKGTAIVNLLSLKPDETIQSMLILDEVKDKDSYITLATKKGLVKKTAVKLYDNIRQSGIIAIVLNDGDELVWGRLTTGHDHILLISHDGKCIRFSEEEVKESNRDTKGVKGITLRASDYVVGVETFSSETETDASGKTVVRQLLVVTEKGLGKRTKFSEYPMQKRSGMGVKVAEVTAKTGKIAAARMIQPEHQELVISTKEGQTIKLPLTKESIPVLTRPTQGVILMRLKPSDQVVAVALTEESGEEEEAK